MSAIELLQSNDAISVFKENGTSVDYYIFDEFEIHKNIIAPHSFQEWHRHKIIDETYFVISGEIVFCWVENNKEQSITIRENDALCAKKSIHTIKNPTDQNAEFLVFRMVPTGNSQREIIKTDKDIIEADRLVDKIE